MQGPNSLIWALLGTLVVGCSQFEPFRQNQPEPEAQEAPKWVGTRQAEQATGAGTGTPAPGPHAAPAPRVTPLALDDWTRTAQALPTGDLASSVLLLEKLAPKEVVLGVDFEYQLLISNLTSVPLEQVVILEQATPNLLLRESEPAASVDASGAATWNLGTLKPKQQVTILVRAVATGGLEVIGQAQAHYRTTMRSQIAVVVPALDLKFLMPTVAGPAEGIPIELQVRNSGSGAARDILLTVDLPAGLLSEHGDRSISIPVGTLRAGESKAVMIMAQAPAAGVFEASASASMRHGAAVLAPTRRIVIQQAVLALDVSGPSQAFLGRPSRWTLRVCNTGDGAAKQVAIEHLIPVGMSFVQSSQAPQRLGDKLVWQLGSLPAGTSKSIELYLEATEPGTGHVMAQVSAKHLATLSDSEEVSLAGISALQLEIDDMSDPVMVGEPVTYHVTVTNQGTAPGKDIRVEAILDEGMQLIRPQGPTSGMLEGNKIIFEPLASLAPGAAATWKIVARSTQAGDLRLGAVMTSARLVRPVPETEPTHFHQ